MKRSYSRDHLLELCRWSNVHTTNTNPLFSSYRKSIFVRDLTRSPDNDLLLFAIAADANFSKAFTEKTTTQATPFFSAPPQKLYILSPLLFGQAIISWDAQSRMCDGSLAWCCPAQTSNEKGENPANRILLFLPPPPPPSQPCHCLGCLIIRCYIYLAVWPTNNEPSSPLSSSAVGKRKKRRRRRASIVWWLNPLLLLLHPLPPPPIFPAVSFCLLSSRTTIQGYCCHPRYKFSNWYSCIARSFGNIKREKTKKPT